MDFIHFMFCYGVKEMINYNKEYMDLLNTAWEKFTTFQDFDFSFMRPEIFQSWQRSRDFQVNPKEIKTDISTKEDIEKLSESNDLLISTVRPYMEDLYSIVQGSGFYLMLSDQNGIILDLLGDQDIINEGRKNSFLVVGANRSESFAGTNAIGTCLAIGKPLQIWGGEHYILGHKKYACSAAPIFDHEGEIIGCLNLTGEFTKIHTHTLGMVIGAVDGISKELKIRSAYNEIAAMSAQRSSILESVSSGLILLNGNDQIIQMNGNALRMLNINKNSIGKNIFESISIDEPVHKNFNFSTVKTEMQNKETTFYFMGSQSAPVKFSMSINFIGGNNSENRSVVVRLDESKQINKLVSKVSGFKASYTFQSIIGSSIATQKLINTSSRAAQSSSNALIFGESGTGKELVAQSIHNSSSYAKGPFVAINCGALPKGLIESELFGYEGGAYTGASKEGNPGKFELADGGTIFLDEIGDMPLDVQVTLLRVIQTKEVVRIGGKYPKKINVRIIAATNRNLFDAIDAKTFREDLFYRLNVLSINVPPLRERENDVCELADYFAETLNNPQKLKMHISQDVYPVLKSYSWPGNIRELENVIERAINITDDDEIRLEHLPIQIRANSNIPLAKSAPFADKTLTPSVHNHAEIPTPPMPGFNLKSTGYQLILSSLEERNGNIKEAAELLGISRRTLYRKMDLYGIDYKNYRE